MMGVLQCSVAMAAARGSSNVGGYFAGVLPTSIWKGGGGLSGVGRND